MREIVLSCFDKTTRLVRPWADAGYLCYCVDLQHPKGETREGNIIKVGADLLTWLPPREKIAFAAFFPPCTHVAVSGARWFKEKGFIKLIEALQLFEISIRLAQWCQAPYFIENPVSVISSYWRKPDYIFHPYEYAGYSNELEAYTKKTCLWTGNGFVMPEKDPVMPLLGSKMHSIPPLENRADQRSETPLGFAKAVFLANDRQRSMLHLAKQLPMQF